MTRPDDRIDGLDEALTEIRAFPVYEPPAGVWNGIVSELDRAEAGRREVAVPTSRVEPAIRPTPRPSRPVVRRVRTALGAAAVVTLISTYALGSFRSSWSIDRVAGTPVAGARAIATRGTLEEGEWLETDSRSRARLSIGTLGTADVGPGSRVKLVQAGGTERALRVERGSIDARVWAPPRFFLVETPAARAVDLGCVYSLDVDSLGNGTLLVRSGQVELQGPGHLSVVVAGTAAQMRSGVGPGTPYSASESPEFRDALSVVDFGGADRSAALERVLDSATARSTITLWHLLPRVDAHERALVYDRLAALSPPPDGVMRAAVIALDDRALGRWRSALEPSWSTERVRLWKQAWRAIWSFARGR
jgi:hypothetical protein